MNIIQNKIYSNQDGPSLSTAIDRLANPSSRFTYLCANEKGVFEIGLLEKLYYSIGSFFNLIDDQTSKERIDAVLGDIINKNINILNANNYSSIYKIALRGNIIQSDDNTKSDPQAQLNQVVNRAHTVADLLKVIETKTANPLSEKKVANLAEPNLKNPEEIPIPGSDPNKIIDEHPENIKTPENQISLEDPNVVDKQDVVDKQETNSQKIIDITSKEPSQMGRIVKLIVAVGVTILAAKTLAGHLKEGESPLPANDGELSDISKTHQYKQLIPGTTADFAQEIPLPEQPHLEPVVSDLKPTPIATQPQEQINPILIEEKEKLNADQTSEDQKNVGDSSTAKLPTQAEPLIAKSKFFRGIKSFDSPPKLLATKEEADKYFSHIPTGRNDLTVNAHRQEMLVHSSFPADVRGRLKIEEAYQKKGIKTGAEPLEYTEKNEENLKNFIKRNGLTTRTETVSWMGNTYTEDTEAVTYQKYLEKTKGLIAALNRGLLNNIEDIQGDMEWEGEVKSKTDVMLMTARQKEFSIAEMRGILYEKITTFDAKVLEHLAEEGLIITTPDGHFEWMGYRGRGKWIQL